MGPEKFDLWEIKSKDTFGRSFSGKDRIHFPEIKFVSMSVLEIFVGSTDEDFPVHEVFVMGGSLFELDFSL